ncbi:Zn-dependent exopeptidase [Atractiella rhizophila]|nr:Zn-dependent exopeptidase [Atractiella rhizophila]
MMEMLREFLQVETEERYVQLSPDAKDIHRITEGEKTLLRLQGKAFIDVTDSLAFDYSSPFVQQSPEVEEDPFSIPDLKYTREDLKDAFANTWNEDKMEEFLTEYSGFTTRYYRSRYGAEASDWLGAQILALVNSYDLSPEKAPVLKAFPHSWGQNSWILTFPSASPSARKVITGAHLDSANMLPFLPAPGADDDGSGTTSNLGALAAVLQLVKDGWESDEEIEFQWYSAEEAGLLGSQAIAKAYKADNVKVKGMLQMDMTAWLKQGRPETFGIFADYVNPNATAFLEKLVTEHLDIPFAETLCHYGCSDHASFFNAGYPSAGSAESIFQDFSPYAHSVRDTINHEEFSFSHMRKFSIIATAWMVELGGMKKN